MIVVYAQEYCQKITYATVLDAPLAQVNVSIQSHPPTGGVHLVAPEANLTFQSQPTGRKS